MLIKEKQGVLQILRVGFLYNSWEDRWVVVRHGSFLCFKDQTVFSSLDSPQEQNVEKVLSLNNFDVASIKDSKGKKNCFAILLKKENKTLMTFATSSAEEKKNWLNHLKTTAEKALQTSHTNFVTVSFPEDWDLPLRVTQMIKLDQQSFEFKNIQKRMLSTIGSHARRQNYTSYDVLEITRSSNSSFSITEFKILPSGQNTFSSEIK